MIKLKSIIQPIKLNESTFVNGKFQVQKKFMKIALDSHIDSMKQNISESPNYDETKSKSDKALQNIDKAYTKFLTELEKAVTVVGNNYTGV